jgi:hypothetical protein
VGNDTCLKCSRNTCNTPDKVHNMIQNISGGRIAPVELVARKS